MVSTPQNLDPLTPEQDDTETELIEDEYTDPSDQLQQLEYNENTTPAERSLEIEQDQQQRLHEQAERIKNAENKLQKAGQAPKNEAVKQASKAEGSAVRHQARAAAKATGEAAKKAAQATARAANVALQAAKQFLLKNPYVWAAIGILFLILVLIALAFALASLGRNTGGGPAIPPKTASQKLAATELQALTGNQLANTELVIKASSAAKKRLEQIRPLLSEIYGNSNAQLTGATQAVDALIGKIDSIISEKSVATRKQLITAVHQDLVTFNITYPEVMGYGAVRGAYLPVPGVIEATKGDCGQASVLMVVRYYKPDFEDATYYDAANNRTKDNTGCVSPEYINSKTGHQDWDRFSNANSGFAAVRRSLEAGDPVIMYTSPGSIYQGLPHIFVIVGYDPETKTYIINNPYRNGVQLATNNPNNISLTEERLLKYLGENHYGHKGTFMMRGKYTK